MEGAGLRERHGPAAVAYDWRQDNRESAQHLRQKIDEWRRAVLSPDKKFTIVCHSMGALVSRYYIECLGGAPHVERLVTIGGAHFGSPFVVRVLLYGPRLLPPGLGNKAFHKVLISMPSSYQLVPPYPVAFGPDGQLIDLHADDSWIKPEHRGLLKKAKEFHNELGSNTSVPTTCIFGYGVKTVTKIRVDERGPDGWEKVRFVLEQAGDNRVVDRDGYLKGSDLHPVLQHHGALWTDNDVKMRLRLELLG